MCAPFFRMQNIHARKNNVILFFKQLYFQIKTLKSSSFSKILLLLFHFHLEHIFFLILNYKFLVFLVLKSFSSSSFFVKNIKRKFFISLEFFSKNFQNKRAKMVLVMEVTGLPRVSHVVNELFNFADAKIGVVVKVQMLAKPGEKMGVVRVEFEDARTIDSACEAINGIAFEDVWVIEAAARWIGKSHVEEREVIYETVDPSVVIAHEWATERAVKAVDAEQANQPFHGFQH